MSLLVGVPRLLLMFFVLLLTLFSLSQGHNASWPDWDKESHTWIYFDGVFCRKGKTIEEATVMDTMDNVLNAEVIVNDDAFLPLDNMAQFDQIVNVPMCGTRYYALFAYCAKVNFFGIKGVEFARQHLLNMSRPTSVEELESAGYMQDMALLLLDGCVECKRRTKGDANITLYIEQYLSKGPIATVCPETAQIRSVRTVELDQDERGSFVTGAILSERLCPHQPDQNSSSIKMAVPSYAYKHTRLIVEHNCAETNTDDYSMRKLILELPDIALEGPNAIMDHVIEVRHINLSLDTLKDVWNAKLDWEQKDKNRGQDVGGSYFIAKEPKTVAQKCGNRNWPEAKEKGRYRPLIAGGTIVPDIRKWPWMASLVYQMDNSDKVNHFCSASIIGPNFLLTAAHCSPEQMGIDESNLIAVIGSLNNHANVKQENGQQQSRIRVKKFHIHEDYQRRLRVLADFNKNVTRLVDQAGLDLTESMDKLLELHGMEVARATISLDDIALVELAEQIPFNDDIYPICLPKHLAQRLYINNDINMHIAGWGSINLDGDILMPVNSRKTTRKPKSHVAEEIFLHEGKVQITNCTVQSLNVDFLYEGDKNALNAKQTDILKKYKQLLSQKTNQAIREARGKKYFCVNGTKSSIRTGDSGGPLMYRDGCCWAELGIACMIFLRESSTHRHIPAQYTRVSHYCDWIEEKTGGEVKCKWHILARQPVIIQEKEDN